MREPIHSGKVSEAALSKSIAVSVVGILLCMICLVGTTWAWYSLSIESGANMTEGANFDFTVTVTETDPSEGTFSLGENGTYTFKGGTYTVTLTKVVGCTATKGFCKVIATKNGEVDTIYYTVDFTNTGSIEFTVTGFGTLKLIPMLGTPAGGYVPLPGTGIALASEPPTEAGFEQEETTSEEEEIPEEEEPIDEEPDGEETDKSTGVDEGINEEEQTEEQSEESAAETTELNQGQTETPTEQEPQE